MNILLKSAALNVGWESFVDAKMLNGIMRGNLPNCVLLPIVKLGHFLNRGDAECLLCAAVMDE